MAPHVGSRLSRVAAAGAILLGLLMLLSLPWGPSRAADPKEGAAASGAESAEAAEAVQAPPKTGKEAAHKGAKVQKFQSREAAQNPEKREAAQKPETAQKPEEAGNGDTASADEPEEPPMIDPLSVNAACYVCHMTFIGEELSTVHFQEKTMCVDCHGLSAPHANDENIGATPPDIVFKRHEVDASCEKCHEDHDAPGSDVVARFLERKLTDPRPICTDCHGMHKIEQPEEADEDDQGDVTSRQPQPTMKPATLTSK